MQEHKLIRAWLLFQTGDGLVFCRVDDPVVHDLRDRKDRAGANLFRTLHGLPLRRRLPKGGPSLPIAMGSGSVRKKTPQEIPLKGDVVMVGHASLALVEHGSPFDIDLEQAELVALRESSPCGRCGHLELFHKDSLADGDCCVGNCDCGEE